MLNPVTGPVFVRGAHPGDVLEVEVLELGMTGWGWTATIPGFGLLADQYPNAWLRGSVIDGRFPAGIPGLGTRLEAGPDGRIVLEVVTPCAAAWV